jgi:hypothetical protein
MGSIYKHFDFLSICDNSVCCREKLAALRKLALEEARSFATFVQNGLCRRCGKTELQYFLQTGRFFRRIFEIVARDSYFPRRSVYRDFTCVP